METGITFLQLDNRGRLILDKRISVWPGGTIHIDWHYEYEYDNGGNRTWTRSLTFGDEREIEYHYDINDVAGYGTANNRLEYYDVFDTSGKSTTLMESVYYYYNDFGSVTRIVSEKADPQPGEPAHYSSTWFGYARNGQTVSYAVGETWNWNGVRGHDPTNYTIVFAREFRYDGARQRYLNRELDAVSFVSGQVLVMEETWSDYDGDQIYADFTVDSGTVTVTATYEPGIAKSSAPLDPQGALYYHADHLGTTRLTSNHWAVAFSESAYSAFGERHSGMNNRYGYAGAWGYQSHSMDEVDPPHDLATI